MKRDMEEDCGRLRKRAWQMEGEREEVGGTNIER
jgi:hypothetical protein